MVILGSDFERLQVIPGAKHGNIQVGCVDCSLQGGQVRLMEWYSVTCSSSCVVKKLSSVSQRNQTYLMNPIQILLKCSGLFRFCYRLTASVTVLQGTLVVSSITLLSSGSLCFKKFIGTIKALVMKVSFP